MKSFKIALAALLVFGAIATLAFVKPRATVVQYYVSGTDNQRLLDGINSGPALEQSIESTAGTVFYDLSSWTTTPQSFTATSDMSKYIGSIEYDPAVLTLSQALSQVATAYNSTTPNAMPAIINSGSANQVKVFAATVAH